MCFRARLRHAVAALPAAALLVGAALRADAADDPIARARGLYNQHQYAAAINAAEQARLVPARRDAADLIAARAYLERFRESAASDDLTNARERLRRIDALKLAPVERTELVVGLGEALFFDGAFGAAANVFASTLDVAGDLPPDARDRALDWWATAIDRDAWPRPELDRRPMYQRIRERMERELAMRPASTAASYWMAAAARAEGDLQAAWDAVEAAWVRAPLAPDRGQALRSDLDRLMERAIIPERARAGATPPETLRLEWERFKERWKPAS